MLTRQPCASQFYQGDCKAQMEAYAIGFTPPEAPKRIVAGIVPHAGWFFSGATAAKVFLSIRARRDVDTFILFGSVHVPGVRENSLYAEGAWDTPLGPVHVDLVEAELLLDELSDVLVADTRAHKFEHSIEVQLPMIKHLFPQAKILPIAVPPGENAVELGDRIGRRLREVKKEIAVVGTSDLTHYGDNYGFAPAGYGKPGHEWMVKNDRRMIELALKVKADEILAEAAANQNACGPGALAAAVAAAGAMGAKKGHLIEHTTSFDVYPMGEFDMGVGYAGIVF